MSGDEKKNENLDSSADVNPSASSETHANIHDPGATIDQPLDDLKQQQNEQTPEEAEDQAAQIINETIDQPLTELQSGGTSDPDATIPDSGGGSDSNINATVVFGADSNADADATIAASDGAIDEYIQSTVEKIGNYEIIKELARGGMGVVYLAKQPELNRTVAIKMMLSGQHADETDIKRFQIEAEATAHLNHPGIVGIYDIGVHEGRHYFSMEFVEGQSLAELVKENPLPPKEAATFMRQIAEAMHYAHEHGILHRDLKPANILVDKETKQPRITDFGLAKRVDDGSQLTQTGVCMGTPSYMPPEQASGDAKNLGPAADTYSLGAILYELLTGRPPFQAATPLDVLLLVIEQEPVSPRTLNPGVPLDLETISLKCLQKDPKQRYESAQALADDIERWQNGEPISARPISEFTRAIRWCKRNPKVTGLVGLVAMLLVAVAVISLSAAIVISNEQQRTEIARNRFETYFQHARDTVNELTGLATRMENVRRMEPVRQEILATAQKFHEGFLDEKSDDPAVKREAARAYHNIGKILRMGGKIDESKESLMTAIELLSSLRDTEIEEYDYRHDLAMFHNDLGELLRTNGAVEEAEPEYLSALQLEKSAFAEFQDNLSIQSELTRINYNLALLFLNTGRLKESNDYFDMATDLAQSLVRQEPQTNEYQHHLARSYMNHSPVLRQLSLRHAAQESCIKALDIFATLLDRSPDDRQYMHEIATTYANLGNLQAAAKSTDEAEESYAEAISFLTDLTEGFPDAPDYQKDLANACNGLGGLQIGQKRYEEAGASFRKAIDILTVLTDQFPEVPDYHHLLSGALSNQSRVLLETKQPEEARAQLERAIKHEQLALEANAENLMYKTFLRNHYWVLAVIEQRLNNHDASVVAAEKLPKIISDDPSNILRAARLVAQSIEIVAKAEDLDDNAKQQKTNDYLARIIVILDAGLESQVIDLDAIDKALESTPLAENPKYKEWRAGRQTTDGEVN